jgi:glutathione S-transferase
MKLYGSLTSPYVRKARIALAEKGVPFEFVVAGANDPGSPVPSLNPLGKVPVLERDDGDVVFDSLVIAEYVDSLKNRAALFPASGEPRWQVLRWQALGQGMLDATVARLMETRRPADKQVASSVTHQEAKIAAALKYADAKLRGAYLVGDRLTMADIALAVALEYLDFRFNSDWRRQYPRLDAWLAPFGARASFVDTRPPKG